MFLYTYDEELFAKIEALLYNTHSNGESMMKKGLSDGITKETVYKVDLYQLLGKSYIFDDYWCDVVSLGKILVSVNKKDGNPFRDNIGECTEVKEGFSVPLIHCSMSSRYDGWYDEHVTEFYLPYKYNYWDKYSLFIVRSEDIKESNLATLEDLKTYDPQNETWYEVLKEIQEKGIDFDYEQEAIEEMYGKTSNSGNQTSIKKKG